MKPFVPASDRNKEPILAALREILADARSVLEIGSGTGQHAVHFAAALEHLVWHTSELEVRHRDIEAWLADAGLDNVCAPITLDVLAGPWPARIFDAAYSANTAHIMSWPAVCAMMAGVSGCLRPGGRFALYGPFRYHGRHTGPGNVAFDRTLRAEDPAMGIRDVDDLDACAEASGLVLERDVPMPSDNRLRIWRRIAGTHEDDG